MFCRPLLSRDTARSRSVRLVALIVVVGCTGETLPIERSGFVNVENARLKYVTVGRGPPLIVVPGGPGFPHTYLFDPLTELFAEQRQLTFYDPRGSGSSSGHESAAGLTMSTFVEDLDAIRLMIEAERIDLMGHSFGGLLALHYALRHPDATRSLILVDSDPPTWQDWNHFRAVLAARRAQEETTRLDVIHASNGWERDPEVVQEYFRLLLRPYFGNPELARRLTFGFDENSFQKLGVTSQAVRDDLGEWNVVDELSSLQLPILIVAGERSIFPLAAAEALHAALPMSQLEVMLGVGHFPFIENPAAFGQLVVGFLAGSDK